MEVLQNGQYARGFKDVFSIVIIFKLLLNEKDFKEFYNIVVNEIEKLM